MTEYQYVTSLVCDKVTHSLIKFEFHITFSSMAFFIVGVCLVGRFNNESSF